MNIQGIQKKPLDPDLESFLQKCLDASVLVIPHQF